jgi:hypothetical protein
MIPTQAGAAPILRTVGVVRAAVVVPIRAVAAGRSWFRSPFKLAYEGMNDRRAAPLPRRLPRILTGRRPATNGAGRRDKPEASP